MIYSPSVLEHHCLPAFTQAIMNHSVAVWVGTPLMNISDNFESVLGRQITIIHSRGDLTVFQSTVRVVSIVLV